MNTNYPRPCRYKDTLVVCIEDKSCDPRKFKGGLRLCEPEELWHAYLFAAYRDIDSGSYSDEELEPYHTGIRAVSFKFMYVQNAEQAFWHATQKREDIVQTYEACARSGLQRIDESIYVMALKNLSTPREVEAMYQTLNLARSTEQINFNLVRQPPIMSGSDSETD